MDSIWTELTTAWPDNQQFARIGVRLTVAALLGAVIGFQRERVGKAAGLRTHMLVALGAALFVVAGRETGMSPGEVGRIIQGLCAGIGFLGAGAIMKMQDEGEVRGLTTAAGIWMTAAVGATTGLGLLGAAALSAALTWIILAILWHVENRTIQRSGDNHA